MVAANKLSYTEIEEGTELILLEQVRTEENLLLEFSLYRITLRSGIFYLVSVEMLKEEAVSSESEILGTDLKEAEAIFKQLVCGRVPPSTLREIVFELRETREYAAALG